MSHPPRCELHIVEHVSLVTRKRLGLGMLAVLAVLALVAVVVVGVAHSRVPRDQLAVMEPGAFDADDAASGEYRLGSDLVVVDSEGVRVESPGGTVWASSPGTAFLTAAIGSTGWEEHRGYFWPNVSHAATWDMQRITGVDTAGDSVTLTGVLTDSSDAEEGTSEMRLRLPFEVRFEARTEGGVTAHAEVGGDAGADAARSNADVEGSELRPDLIAWTGARTDSAGVHGFGEQFDTFDASGRLIPIVIREQGVGRGEQPLTFLADLTNTGAGGTHSMTYAAWPSYVTDDLQGVRLSPDADSSHAFAIADTRTADRVGLEVWAPEMRLELTHGETPVELLQQQFGEVDRPPLAQWTQEGAIVGVQGGTDKVRRVVDDLERAGTKIAGVWIQDWTGRRTTDFGDRLWWTWQLDDERYPGWDQLVTDLRDRGIRTTTYVNPWLVDAAPKGDEGIRNLWAEARDGGLLVERPGGGPYMLDQGQFDAALVDLTNPEARDWMSSVVAEEVLANGVDGFMADFGEALPMDAVLHSGDAETMHNAWPRLWAETVREGCEKAGKPDCATWFRAGTMGMDSQTPAFWNGDQTVTWSADDGLASALLGTLSAGVSGWPVVHSDIGGYTSIDAVVRDYVRDEELLARWGEYAAFGPLFRSHESNRPEENRQVYDPDEADAFARNSRLFAALAPYREQVLDEAERTGLPVMRHSWIHFPGTAAATRDDQFLLGDSVLVAPVLKPEATDVEVTFPPGRWIHLPTGESYDGDTTATVAAPIGTPAAFIAAGHPMASDLTAAVRAALGG